MIQCKDCELGEVDEKGNVQLKCSPFINVKEPECLLKWQLLRLDLMTRAYMATIAEYKKIAPLQEKLYRRMSREIDEMDDADSWKHGEGDDKDDSPPLDDRL
ncbi:MAG TPA: hypothetical protein VM238_01465 [Phycisphaerae bacterium]|nr:hypothetical protein [Phycisphaerae bacterium]